MSPELLSQFILSGLTMGSIYALVAIGFNVIYSTTSIINFAQGEFVMIGVMVGFTLTTTFKLPILPALLVTVLVTALLGMLVERVAYNTLRESRAGMAIGWIITTVASGLILQNAAMRIWGSEPLPFPAMVKVQILKLGPAIFDTQQVFIFFSAIALALLTEALIHKTVLGRAFKATSFSRETAEYMGINTRLVILACFALSGGLAAVAGFLVAPLTFASSTMGLMVGLKGFGAAIVGGLGSGRGAIIGGLSLGVLETLIGGGMLPAGYKDAVAFALIILVLVVRPEGLFGEYVFKKA